VSEYSKPILFFFAISGGFLTILELVCYVAIFLYARKMTHLVGGMLKESVIRERHRCNAINLYGQIVTWVMEFWYIFVVGICVNYFESELLREVTPIVKHFDFMLIPLAQIYTSRPLTRYMSNL